MKTIHHVVDIAAPTGDVFRAFSTAAGTRLGFGQHYAVELRDAAAAAGKA